MTDSAPPKFDWEYRSGPAAVAALSGKSKIATWSVEDLDWRADADLERAVYASSAGLGPGRYYDEMFRAPARLTDADATKLVVQMTSYMMSQFLHGEQGALAAAGKLVTVLPSVGERQYAAVQASDEARHVEVYRRYTGRLGEIYPIQSGLEHLLNDVMSQQAWDITFIGMQVLVEGLALAAFRLIRMIVPDEPLLADLTSRVMADEGRHVTFGVASLKGLSAELSGAELREREEFVIASLDALRARFDMSPVIERLGWSAKTWAPWMEDGFYMRSFRQLLFAKIVPNLRCVGLLTPAVARALDQMGLVRWADAADSTQSDEVEMPREFLEWLLPFLHARRAARRGGRGPGA